MAAASLRIAPRHWVYLDEGRTHEVHAEVEATPQEDRLVTTEFPAGSRDANEAIQVVRRVTEESEVQLLLGELERRLALTGTYFRANVADMRWAPVGAPPPEARVDLRALELPVPGAEGAGATMRFHHFHATGGNDLLLISMPRLDVDASKHALAELSFRFPRVDVGDLRVVHTRLTQTTLRSTLVQRHMDLPRQGFAKLLEARDYQDAYGEGWLDHTRAMLGRAASRMVGSRHRQEPDAPLLTRNGKEAPPTLPDVVRALGTQRVAALKARFLGQSDLELALRGGEHVIRRVVNAKRRVLPHTSAYDLSVLEATLLLEYAVRHEVWSLVEEDGEKLLRYVHGYQ